MKMIGLVNDPPTIEEMLRVLADPAVVKHMRRRFIFAQIYAGWIGVGIGGYVVMIAEALAKRFYP